MLYVSSISGRLGEATKPEARKLGREPWALLCPQKQIPIQEERGGRKRGAVTIISRGRFQSLTLLGSNPASGFGIKYMSGHLGGSVG